jgi:hypothetical protein
MPLIGARGNILQSSSLLGWMTCPARICGLTETAPPPL